MPNLMRRLGPFNPAANTDDEWRAHARRFSDALAAVGLQRVKALDFAALTAAGPGVVTFTEGSAHAEVFEFGGPLQNSANLRVLVYHGRQGSTGALTYHPQLRYQFLGVSGHLSWTCPLSSTTNTALESPNASSAWVASDGENWLTYRYGIENAAPNGLASGAVERTHGVDGAYSGDGAYFSHGHFQAVNGSQGSGVLLRGSTGTHPASQFNWAIMPAYPVQSSLRGGRVAAFPHTVPVPGMPPHSVYAAYPSDWTLNEEVQIEGRPYVVVAHGSYPTHAGTGGITVSGFRTLVRLGDQVV